MPAQQPDPSKVDDESGKGDARQEVRPASAATHPSVLRAMEAIEVARQGARDKPAEAAALSLLAGQFGVTEVEGPPNKFPVAKVSENLETLATRIRPKLLNAGKNSDLIIGAVLEELVAAIRDEGGLVATKLGTWKIDIQHYGRRRVGGPEGREFFVPSQWCLSFDPSPTLRDVFSAEIPRGAPAGRTDVRKAMSTQLGIPFFGGKAGFQDISKLGALDKFLATNGGRKEVTGKVQVERPLEAGRVVRAFFGALIKVIDERGKVVIEGFGTFEKKLRSGEFTNPNAERGSKVQVSGRPYVAFDPDSALLRAVLPQGRPPSKNPPARVVGEPTDGGPEA